MRVGSSGKSVKDVGEFALINSIRATTRGVKSERLRVGIGDDAAVWKPRPGRQIVMTSDMLVEDVDFRHSWSDWPSLGHKALAVNLSDIAAMGATPRVALVSLALRGSERERQVIDFFRGMNELAQEHNVVVAGGDISSSESGLVVSITAIGETAVGGKMLMTRSAAKPGDILAVTGPLGLAAAGYQALEQDLKIIDGGPAMREAFTRPTPRIREGRLLARAGIRAAIDLSDGLLGDLPKLCEASGVSALLEEDRLPIPHSLQWAFDDWFDLALRGGEDFELLFAGSRDAFNRACRAFRRAGLVPPIRIGTITGLAASGSEIKIRKSSGKVVRLEPGAYSHFK